MLDTFIFPGLGQLEVFDLWRTLNQGSRKAMPLLRFVIDILNIDPLQMSMWLDVSVLKLSFLSLEKQEALTLLYYESSGTCRFSLKKTQVFL